ncbi:MAG: hypothetical protein ACYC35_12630 [Pirellulales bacterium]
MKNPLVRIVVLVGMILIAMASTSPAQPAGDASADLPSVLKSSTPQASPAAQPDAAPAASVPADASGAVPTQVQPVLPQLPVLPVDDVSWRYRRYDGRWWYWQPSNRWVYWWNGQWVRYDAETYVPGAAVLAVPGPSLYYGPPVVRPSYYGPPVVRPRYYGPAVVRPSYYGPAYYPRARGPYYGGGVYLPGVGVDIRW